MYAVSKHKYLQLFHWYNGGFALKLCSKCATDSDKVAWGRDDAATHLAMVMKAVIGSSNSSRGSSNERRSWPMRESKSAAVLCSQSELTCKYVTTHQSLTMASCNEQSFNMGVCWVLSVLPWPRSSKYAHSSPVKVTLQISKYSKS